MNKSSNQADLWRSSSVSLSVCVSVCLSCGKTAEWIQMLFRVVSGVGYRGGCTSIIWGLWVVIVKWEADNRGKVTYTKVQATKTYTSKSKSIRQKYNEKQSSNGSRLLSGRTFLLTATGCAIITSSNPTHYKDLRQSCVSTRLSRSTLALRQSDNRHAYSAVRAVRAVRCFVTPQDLYSHQNLYMYIYWFSSESSYRRRRRRRRTPQYNH